jgi:membrane protease YdiL (CAAX protease family)
MENQSNWRAKHALVCYLALAVGIFVGSITLGLVLLGTRFDIQDLPYPFALYSIPVNESIILVITLLFAKRQGASLEELGLKKTSLKILTIVSVCAIPLFLLAIGISVISEVLLGPDPMAELLAKSLTPRDLFQLIALIFLSLFLVGPIEELAFRGYVQKGLQNSFGKLKGLIIASVLFGALHGLNSLYAIVPIIAISLILGYVWQKTNGNTIASALMHGIYDSIGLTIAYFATV